ncbi:MAG: heme-binding protein [Lachnospiraceae bacterium]|nr:heme-binding protein [Lachnospiraceae bacterium]
MNEKDMEQIVRGVLAGMGTAKVQPTGIQTTKSLNLETAVALIDKVKAQAERMGIKVVVAVADAAGHPVAVHCMDGAYIGSYDVAVNKAFTCAAFKMPTATLGELAAPGGSLYGIQFTNGGKIVVFGGGDPLYMNDVLIGAIGVSGGSAEQDIELSAYGKNMLKEVIS